MNKFQFKDDYQVSIKYSCSYEIPENIDGFHEIGIECHFEEYFPISRIELEYINPEKTHEITKGQYWYINPFFTRLDNRLSLIIKHAYELPKDDKGNDDWSRVHFSVEPSYTEDETEKYPMILGFKTKIYVHEGDSSTHIHEKVKEWTKDVAALILHSPLLKAEKYDIYENYIIRETKPQRFLDMRL